jgi:hypothetical protein
LDATGGQDNLAVAAGQSQADLAYCVIPPPHLVAKPVPVETESGVEVRHRDGDSVDLLD